MSLLLAKRLVMAVKRCRTKFVTVAIDMYSPDDPAHVLLIIAEI